MISFDLQNKTKNTTVFVVKRANIFLKVNYFQNIKQHKFQTPFVTIQNLVLACWCVALKMLQILVSNISLFIIVIHLYIKNILTDRKRSFFLDIRFP